ncbi:MAG: hypothetical protein H0T51_12010, partial [Pirellulales bacterium]|nr:hypothetical protein [Pirellulales bacterium]
MESDSEVLSFGGYAAVVMSSSSASDAMLPSGEAANGRRSQRSERQRVWLRHRRAEVGAPDFQLPRRISGSANNSFTVTGDSSSAEDAPSLERFAEPEFIAQDGFDGLRNYPDTVVGENGLIGEDFGV